MIKRSALRWTVLMSFPISNGRCFSEGFECGRTVMDPCAVRLKYLIAARTPSAIACVESRNVTADPSRGRGMSPNRVWLSKYIAVYVAETHWRC